MNRFYYGMRKRGFSIGCQPMKGFLERQDSNTVEYYDIIVYDRQLTNDEERYYSLTPLNEGTLTPKIKVTEYIKKNHGPYTICGIKFGLFYVNKGAEMDINEKHGGASFKELLPVAIKDIEDTLDKWSGTVQELKEFFNMYADNDGIYRCKNYYVPVNEIKGFVPFGVVMK